jgi:lipopolysaccharide transport system permease protein
MPAADSSGRVVKSTPRSSAVWSLAWTLVRTDFKSRYHGTLGGFFWAFLKPLAMFVVLASVFSFIFASDSRYTTNLLIGLFLYEFFAEGTKTGLQALHAKGFLVGKAKFPLWIIVVASISNAALSLTLFGVILTIWTTATQSIVALQVVPLFVTYVASYCAVVVGFSLGASVLFLKYRDLNQVWEVVVQAGLFLAPVIYPLSIIPERFQFYLYLWPPTPVIQFTRLLFVDGAVPTLRAHTFLYLEAAVVLLAGALIFRRYAPSAAENL